MNKYVDNIYFIATFCYSVNSKCYDIKSLMTSFHFTLMCCVVTTDCHLTGDTGSPGSSEIQKYTCNCRVFTEIGTLTNHNI